MSEVITVNIAQTRQDRLILWIFQQNDKN